VINIAKDGTRLYIENSILLMRNSEGGIIGFRGISRDVTERKRMEEERRQLEEKAQFASRLASVGEMASGIAHEINNPLTGVIGYAQLLLQENLPDRVRKDLETINDGAQRVANVVQRLLAFARQNKPQRTYVNINDVVATTLELRAYHLQTSNIKVTTQLDTDLPLTIADAGQLQQVFLNLIVNAETEINLARGSGKLTVKTQSIDETIRISFKDDGRGIAQENLEKIFEPFFTTRQVGQGTGLGLSVCYGIVTEHSGRIYAESKPGKGASFIVELPVITEDKQLQLPELSAPEQQKQTGAKVLVVDDEPVVREFISKVLTAEGHQVEAVDNAEDALELVRNKMFRIILLDIKMPGMSGIDLYKRFQKIAPSLARKVIFVTGDVMGTRTTAFLSKAKSPYITKPFNANQLKIAINRVFTEGR
jgi:signal transduction histidine kinase/CheY-like chemotaxis protein